MKKRDIITGTIAEYDFPNKGSFMCGDRKVTIKGALPGQEVSAQVIKLKSGSRYYVDVTFDEGASSGSKVSTRFFYKSKSKFYGLGYHIAY